MFRWGGVFQKTAIFLAVILVLGLVGCVPTQRKQIDLKKKADGETSVRRESDEEILKFGFDPRLDPVEEAKIYAPLLQYLEKETGYEFEIRFTKKSEHIVDNLGEGVVDFAAIGAVNSIIAHDKYDSTCLVRGLNAQGKAEYQSAIFTKPDSQIEKIEDIHGCSFAFGDENSTQGYLIPRIVLLDAGITLNDLREYVFTSSHQNCAEAVISGAYEAGGLQDTLAKSLEEDGLIKIIAMSDYYPSSGIAANKDVDPKIVEAVKKALVEFDPTGEDKEELYHWEKTEMAGGFIEREKDVECDGSGYKKIREAMSRFGLLPLFPKE